MSCNSLQIPRKNITPTTHDMQGLFKIPFSSSKLKPEDIQIVFLIQPAIEHRRAVG